MSNFFILGLPRSRTAWLSTFFTAQGYLCYHEGINGCNSIAEYKAKVSHSFGDSTTNVGFMDFEKHFPKAKYILIHGDLDKAIAYGHEMENMNKVDMVEVLTSYDKLIRSMPGLHVDINDINDRLEEMFDYVTNGATMSRVIADNLIKLNIQIQQPYDFKLTEFLNLMEDINGNT